MKESLRFAVASVPFVVLAACGGSTPPPPPPPPPAPQVEPPSLPVVDAGAADAAPVAQAPALPAPTVVAARQGTVRALAVENRWLYWLTQTGDVKRSPVAGGSVLTVASFGADPASLAVSAGMLYVAQFDSKKKACVLYRVNPDLSNKPETLTTQSGTLCDVAANAKRVALGVQTGKKYAISIWEKGSNAVKKLTPADSALGDDLAIGNDAAYFDDGGRVVSVPFAASAKAKDLVTVSPGVVFDMTFAGDRLFLIVQNGGPSDFENETLASVPAAGGELTPIVKQAPYLGNFATDGDSLYWSSSGSSAAGFQDGKVAKLALSAAGGATVTLADHQLEPHGVAVDPDFVYFANDKGQTSDTDSDIVKVAK